MQLRMRALVAAGAVLCAGSAFAQTDPKVAPKTVAPPQVSADVATLQAQRTALFQRMLDKPDDLDAAFKYAALSAQVGDLEAAIATLERMLIFAPGLPRLQLELGVLYYRLGAFETARTYFKSAISGPQVPDEVRLKVEEYLSGIATAEMDTRFSGQIRAGVRYQTNANRAPGLGTVLTSGGLTIDPGSVGAADTNAYAAGLFHYSHDLPSQGDSLEVDLVTYASKQFERDELDTVLAEVTFGPALDMGRVGIDNAVLGIYGIAAGVFVNDHFYSAAGGVGTRFVIRPSARMSSLTAFEYRYRDYQESSAAPTANNRDGNEYRLYTSNSYIVMPTFMLNGGAYVQRTESEFGYLAYIEAGISGGFSYAFASPLGGQYGPWTLSPTAGFIYREYDDADPVIDPTEAEIDHEVYVGASLLVPVAQSWSLLADTEYRDVSSNYAIRDYDNLSVSLSVVKRF
ncbi:tetratricopeptide repeat protein [Aquibium sp. ELW1220]|uniref:tetratricopeptide repeat protein n=1 Tax=Aquibium sp. ELW1220 TaxID=2976766 RepID=UPI0025B19655|nr:tetratricopeptide repeat protein [Aquibium sp. ELW1220]MDN2582827.1 tetratricopeptide repeat protein [Aquibium sp. ELW1220]